MEIIKKHSVRWAAVILEWLIFFLFTALVMFVDVRPIGPEASSVGFASLNQWVAKAFPYRPFFHKISDYLGYLAILLDGTFALIALSQWISRRKLWAVDHNLLFLMFFYTVVVIIYFACTKIVINYRPVILESEGGLESSYPSSHTVLAVASFYTAVLNIHVLLKKENLQKLANALCTFFGIALILSRVASGIHWFTDIIGSLLLIASLVMTYLAALTAPASAGHYQGKRVSK